MTKLATIKSTICWHEPGRGRRGRQQCRKPHKDDRFFVFGRCQSGSQWFWAAGDETHCAIGFEASQPAALAAARAAVQRLAGNAPAVAVLSSRYALDRLKDVNSAKRAAVETVLQGGGDLLRISPAAVAAERQRFVGATKQQNNKQASREFKALADAWENASEPARTRFMLRAGLIAHNDREQSAEGAAERAP